MGCRHCPRAPGTPGMEPGMELASISNIAGFVAKVSLIGARMFSGRLSHSSHFAGNWKKLAASATCQVYPAPPPSRAETTVRHPMVSLRDHRSAGDRPQTDHQGSAARRCVQRQKEAAMAINLVSLISQFVTP